ncbi:hypothetical protein [Polycladidibacter stylochi]|uniref:hypothetical protein n=1 Tax=Polycladidibacter stylochi TaxID=1807766 RepID=UPI00082A26BA|nr:hypothetical protein [Pseudovibrio stylochi]
MERDASFILEEINAVMLEQLNHCAMLIKDEQAGTGDKVENSQQLFSYLNCLDQARLALVRAESVTMKRVSSNTYVSTSEADFETSEVSEEELSTSQIAQALSRLRASEPRGHRADNCDRLGGRPLGQRTSRDDYEATIEESQESSDFNAQSEQDIECTEGDAARLCDCEQRGQRGEYCSCEVRGHYGQSEDALDYTEEVDVEVAASETEWQGFDRCEEAEDGRS